MVCFHCKEKGHKKPDCPYLKKGRESFFTKVVSNSHLNTGLFCETQDDINKLCSRETRSSVGNFSENEFQIQGLVNGRPVTMQVDCGASQTTIKRNLISQEINNGSSVPRQADALCSCGTVRALPFANVELMVNGESQNMEVVLDPDLPVSVLLGRDTKLVNKLAEHLKASPCCDRSRKPRIFRR